MYLLFILIYFNFLQMNILSTLNDNASIEVLLKGKELKEGTLLISLHSNDNSFKRIDSQPFLAYRTLKIEVDQMADSLINFKNIPFGTYAISVLVDKNDNDVMDFNLFGKPKEKYGFSTSKYPKFSAPSFNDCTFDVVKDTVISIQLK